MKQSGFTLLELLITIAIAGFLLAATFTTYSSQQKSHVTQDQVGEIQQNIRAAMVTMTRDIREAGCDPTQTSVAGFLIAGGASIQFTRDIAGNAVNPNQSDGDVNDPNERITFSLVGSDIQRADSNPGGTGTLTIGENVDRLQFTYLDEDGNVLTSLVPGDPLVFADLNRIRAVQVSVLVRASRPDPEFTNTKVYTTASGVGWGPFNDNFRRRLAATTIQCRNKEF